MFAKGLAEIQLSERYRYIEDMGRRPKAAAEAAETIEVAAAPVEASAPAVRRRRRTARVDHGAQGEALVGSLLSGRGERGASQAEALAVVMWARGVHEEAAELKTLAARVRRAKAENAAERQVALQLNQTLLSGVLSGSLVVDVDEAGSLAFRKAG